MFVVTHYYLDGVYLFSHVEYVPAEVALALVVLDTLEQLGY
jgi:hypothetical protein